tara:strand:- start:1 stop:201 length:201 start_codon:yes stop_codon:yes gene_type:complete
MTGYGDIHMETEWDGLTVGETTHGVVIIGIVLMDGITTTDGETDTVGITLQHFTVIIGIIIIEEVM